MQESKIQSIPYNSIIINSRTYRPRAGGDPDFEVILTVKLARSSDKLRKNKGLNLNPQSLKH